MEPQEESKSLTAAQRFQLYLHIVDRSTSIIMLAIKAAIVFGFLFAIVSVFEAIAGKATTADINLSLNADANIFVQLFSRLGSSKFAWAVAIAGIVYGLSERELRRRKTAYLQGRITKLEKMLDSNRESSGLTERGETSLGDKL